MEKRLNWLCQPLNLPGSAASSPARLRIPVGAGKLSLAVSEIVRLEGEGVYSWIHMRGGQRYLVSWTLAMVMHKLPQLVRIHKSHLVSPNYIEKLTTYKGRRWLRLTTGEKLPLSRRLCPSFIPIPFAHEHI